MAAALLLAVTSAPSVADAERAFAALAQAEGQWAAFRDTSAPDAIMYAPGPVDARQFVARLPEPAPDHRLNWRPARTITSCDGSLAYSTGPWQSGGKSGGFGTIWLHDGGGWHWIYDGGHDGGSTLSADASVDETQAACPGPIGSSGAPSELIDGSPVPIARLHAGALADLIEASDGTVPTAITLDAPSAEGASADRTLRWRINPIAGGATGAHLLRLWSWDGRRYRLAVLDVTTTP